MGCRAIGVNGTFNYCHFKFYNDINSYTLG